MKHTSVLAGFWVGAVVLLVGCSKQADQLAQGWTPPVKIADSQSAMSGSVDLYKWRDKIILLQQRYDWSSKSATCSIMIHNSDPSNSWTQLPFSSVPEGSRLIYAFYCPAIDQANGRIMFEQGYMENDQLVMRAILVRMAGSAGIQVEAERKWTTDKNAIFGETPTNVTLNPLGKRDWPYLGFGVINGADLYIPYCLKAVRVTPLFNEDGPFNNGVFHSSDSGMNWQMERISGFEARDPSACRTKGCNYYFATGKLGTNNYGALWFSRKPAEGGSWDAPKAVTTTFVNDADGCYVTVMEGETVHICWLDQRHEKEKFDIGVFPPHLTSALRNSEIAYCHRKDSDTDWSKDVIVSQDVFYSFSPSMSVDGDKIVIAWSGNQSTDDYWHMTPNDIYYVTSKDGGKTWAKPLKVTDSAKDGIRTGEPQVALQNGVIHLFYVQGKEDPHEQVRNQPPWPIYYQQRPFPD